MNHGRLLIGLVALLALVGCDQSSEKKPQKHSINYRGQVINLRDKSIEVDNISISNKTRVIRVYDIPADMAQDPSESVAAFDLDQIYAIEPVPYGKCDTKTQFKNRKYYQVRITLNDSEHTQGLYLIDGLQKLMCDEVTGAGPLSREFTFNGFKKVIITDKSERANVGDSHVR